MNGNTNRVIRLVALGLFAPTVVATVVLAALRLPTPPEIVFWALVAVLGAGELGNIGKRMSWKREASDARPPHEGPTP